MKLWSIENIFVNGNYFDKESKTYMTGDGLQTWVGKWDTVREWSTESDFFKPKSLENLWKWFPGYLSKLEFEVD